MATQPNYTAEQEAAIAAAAPLNMDSAKALAAELGKTHRSVIAKARSMGVEYVTKAKPQKRVGGRTKVETVAAIAAAVNLDADKLSGLEKAPALALASLADALDSGE